jgi:hypothetical protein
MSKIASFDIDGVINMEKYPGVYPGPNDVLITGRSIEEKEETLAMLKDKGITNDVFFNQVRFADKTRKTSGQHKGRTIQMLRDEGYDIVIHYEDDKIQADEIVKIAKVKVVLLQHELVEKENVRRPYSK